MIYRVRHRTTYTYETAVHFARCVLRLTPQDSASQTVLSNAVKVTPTPRDRIERLGPFGEQTLTVTIDKPHRSLVIESRSRVDVHTASLGLFGGGGAAAWETIRAAAFASDQLNVTGPAAFLYPTARTPLSPQITEYARNSFPPGRSIIDAADELMRRIHADFTYDSKATDVRTRPAEAFKARRGVCQDFAHIMISGLRGLGLPAGYVSGYLRTNPPPGRPRLEGADATHAWVTLWCGPGLGWIGFDPTNAILVQDDHIVLATGRDYSDVAPIDGILLAPGGQELKVEVDVAPEEALEAAVPAPN